MKKRILIFAAVLLTLMFTLGFSALAASAEEAEPSVSIEKFNLAFEDNIYLKYAVKFTGIEDSEINANNIGMLYWTVYENGFTPGTENCSSQTTGYTTISGEKYYVFEYTHLAAKQLTDYIYAVAYLEYNSETYYSEPVKYSALEYAYNRLGKTSEGTTNTELISLLNNMLAYGASAQQYFDYKEDRLATADFYQITLVGGTLDDGFTSGLYLSTDEVTITAPTELNGKSFSAWKNSKGETVSTDNPAIVSDFTANETYTATYTETKTYSEGLAFTSNGDGTCYVSGIGTCTDTDVVIPPTSPNGDTVIRIGSESFSGNDMITSVIIPNTVTTIGAGSFTACISLTSITIPDSVTSIVCNGFYGSPFLACSNIKSFEIDEKNITYKSIDGSLYTKDGTMLIQYASGRADENFTVPDGVINIYPGAFIFCQNIESIIIPNNVVDIGSGAFGYCSKLTDVYIGAGVTNIGVCAFSNCSSLMNVEIDVNNSMYKTIDGNIYSKDGTVLIQYALGKEATSFVVHSGVSCIGNSAFTGCTNLTSVIMSDGVSSIEDYAFDGCTNLVSVTIPESVTKIGDSAFYDCANLTSITIPENVTEIGESAFYKCTSLTSVYITSIEAWLNIPFSDSSSNPCNYGADLYLNGDLLTQLTIPNSITSISAHAFSGCTSIISVSISDSVTSIEYGAFQNCTNLESVVFGNSITRIRSYLFAGCTNLTSMVIPDSVTRIDNNVFDDSSNLADIYYTGTEEKWGAISIDSNNYSQTNTIIANATIHFGYIPEE